MTSFRPATLTLLAAGAGVLLATAAPAEPPDTNYDESKVKAYTLPDPLLLRDGHKVSDASGWRRLRRPQLLELFRTNVYGRTPERALPVRAEVRSVGDAFGGRATRREVTLHFSTAADGPFLDLLAYLPKAASGKVPVFLGLNFHGNQAVASDPGIALARSWLAEGKGVVDHRATEALRGTEASRWPVERILERGYALATAYYGDVDPDFDDGFRNGVHPLFYGPGQTRPLPDQWGSIGAWAWGLSRALDFLETLPEVDARRVAVIGHSRLGKTALWAGAQDERFAMVVSNDSGEGGAALARRNYGETVKDLNREFPHWFCANYRRFDDDVNALPVDQHELLALIAPRPLYVASATEDRWADPLGEFLAAKAAEPVYRLFGLAGLEVERQPPPDTPVGTTIGYHLRTGTHDVTAWDWERFLDFADRHLRGRTGVAALPR
ncbi:MAG TPA: acetylxylan esterase [Vicinamibacteria bacterium]|nr:acetylxylan esterase [Vicinamibacteria bacterium]